LATLHTLWFHRPVAESAVKVAAIFRLDNLKAFANAIHLHDPGLAVRRRKLGCAGLAALRTSKILNPAIAGHPVNKRRNPETFLCR